LWKLDLLPLKIDGYSLTEIAGDDTGTSAFINTFPFPTSQAKPQPGIKAL
jgi:hypothetical protein